MSFYICSNCGFGSASWIGRCPDCGSWNSLKQQPNLSQEKKDHQPFTVTQLKSIKTIAQTRLKTTSYEFDRVVGGGLVPGSVLLLSGEPGVGKSTLLLQILSSLNTLYVSGEESLEQVKNRVNRLHLNEEQLFFSNTQDIDSLITGIKKQKKLQVVVIDSIQTVYSHTINSPAGSVGQLKTTTNLLINLAKQTNVVIIIVGHITKEGEIAGPKTLEHLVDVVLSLEGEKISQYRILRASKNRFGSTDEVGIFEMTGKGLKSTSNPTIFLQNQTNIPAGMAIVGTAEGQRPLFFEVQALVAPSILPVPRRVVKGFDYNKILLLLAVARKYLSLPLDRYDIYVNVVGGVSIKSPAADLGTLAALISSIKNIPIKKQSLFIGEVGLLGEVRAVYLEEKIIYEAKRLGFKHLYHANTLTHIKALKTLF